MIRKVSDEFINCAEALTGNNSNKKINLLRNNKE